MTFTEHDDEPGVYGMDVGTDGWSDVVQVSPSYDGCTDEFVADLVGYQLDGGFEKTRQDAVLSLADELFSEADELRTRASRLEYVAGQISGAVGGLP